MLQPIPLLEGSSLITQPSPLMAYSCESGCKHPSFLNVCSMPGSNCFLCSSSWSLYCFSNVRGCSSPVVLCTSEESHRLCDPYCPSICLIWLSITLSFFWCSEFHVSVSNFVAYNKYDRLQCIILFISSRWWSRSWIDNSCICRYIINFCVWNAFVFSFFRFHLCFLYV